VRDTANQSDAQEGVSGAASSLKSDESFPPVEQPSPGQPRSLARDLAMISPGALLKSTRPREPVVSPARTSPQKQCCNKKSRRTSPCRPENDVQTGASPGAHDSVAVSQEMPSWTDDDGPLTRQADEYMQHVFKGDMALYNTIYFQDGHRTIKVSEASKKFTTFECLIGCCYKQEGDRVMLRYLVRTAWWQPRLPEAGHHDRCCPESLWPQVRLCTRFQPKPKPKPYWTTCAPSSIAPS
jgi:hypothetical protein